LRLHKPTTLPAANDRRFSSSSTLCSRTPFLRRVMPTYHKWCNN
jgi:hypothetical protein